MGTAGLNRQPGMRLMTRKPGIGLDEGDENNPKFYFGRSPVKYEFHFPDEVWEVILNNLTEDEDLTNCCRAFPLFDRLLTKTKPVWMFKEILPFIYTSFLKRKDVLTCRRICKQWYDDIEDQATKSDFHFPEEFYSFSKVDVVDRFTTKFQAHSINGRNPFIHRFISIDSFREDELKTRLLDLMSNFGMHVWSLQFYWNLYPAEDDFRFFTQLLAKTPNLKELSSYATSRLIFSPSMAGSPLPTISTLTTLNLNVFCCKLEELTNPKSFIYSLTATLKKLTIRYFEAAGVITLSGFLRIFQHLPVLEKLIIKDPIYITGTQVGIPEFKNSTLRVLSIQTTEERGNRKGLPISFNFIRGFKALEKLKVALGSPSETYLGRSEGKEQLQFYKMLEQDQIYESNIWTILPALITVKVKCNRWFDKVAGDREGFVDYHAVGPPPQKIQWVMWNWIFLFVGIYYFQYIEGFCFSYSNYIHV